MCNNNVLWLDDQIEGLKSYRMPLIRAGYFVDYVKSVSDAINKLRAKEYAVFVCDIKVLPGKDKNWIDLDEKKQVDHPNFDSYLGIELLRSLFTPESARIKLTPPIDINPTRVIVLSVVCDSIGEITAFGIPRDQIVYKSTLDFSTLPKLIEKVQSRCK